MLYLIKVKIQCFLFEFKKKFLVIFCERIFEKYLNCCEIFYFLEIKNDIFFYDLYLRCVWEMKVIVV